MNQISTVEQLRCAGVVAAVTISRSAFPNRLEHELVLDRFKSLWAIGDEHAHLSGDPAEAKKKDVERMLSLALKALETENNGVVVRAFVIGKTRAYFRAGALEHLEAERLKGLSTWATEIQRVIRSFVCRAKFLRQRTAAIKACSKIRQFLQRLKFVHARKACVTMQCWARCVEASALLVRVRLNNRATKIQNMWRCYVARVAFQSNRNAAIVIQRIARGAIQRPRFRKDLEEKREEAKLENQLKALQRKLEEAEEKRLEAERRAAEKPKEVIVVREDTGEETRSSTTSPQTRLTANAVESGSVTPTIGQLTAQQQTLMDESGKMLEYLRCVSCSMSALLLCIALDLTPSCFGFLCRKEVFKLRSQNAQLRTDFDLLKENNQRLMDANASAGASFAALNQHAKHLNKTNAKLTAEVTHYKQQIQKTNLAQAEVKEELKMKQATYIAEVHARLQYQKTLTKIVDIIQDRCRDTRLVEDVLQLSDECEEIYMNGPTGLNSGFLSSLTTPRAEQSDGQSSIVGRFKSFFS
jgi:myosin-5